MPAHPASLAAALQAAEARLQGRSDTPALDAALLLCHVLDCPRSFLLSHPDTQLDETGQRRFAELTARRAQGEPVAYLTGSKGFWTLELQVTPEVLIPRPETETLVEVALAKLPPERPARVADLGTGSGAIALALAQERPLAQVVATDASAAALALARTNAAAHGIGNVEFRQGDWYAPLAGERFDLIVSNPPYVAAGDPHLAALRHEPQTALVGGADGLDALRRIVAGAAAHLLPGGWLLLEHGADQGEAVCALLRAAGMEDVGTLPDLAGLPRVSLGRTSGFQ